MYEYYGCDPKDPEDLCYWEIELTEVAVEFDDVVGKLFDFIIPIKGHENATY